MTEPVKQLEFNRRILLLGYYKLIEQAPGNGACVHKAKQFLTVLKMRIGMGMDITKEYESEIKEVIRRLYPNNSIDNRSVHSNLLE